MLEDMTGIEAGSPRYLPILHSTNNKTPVRPAGKLLSFGKCYLSYTFLPSQVTDALLTWRTPGLIRKETVSMLRLMLPLVFCFALLPASSSFATATQPQGESAKPSVVFLWPAGSATLQGANEKEINIPADPQPGQRINSIRNVHNPFHRSASGPRRQSHTARPSLSRPAADTSSWSGVRKARISRSGSTASASPPSSSNTGWRRRRTTTTRSRARRFRTRSARCASCAPGRRSGA